MRFSIIIPWYQESVSDEDFALLLESLTQQECQDFEVLIYHDGELLRPVTDRIQTALYELCYNLTAEGERMNQWGHNNRNRGIKEARGEYIIHLNCDNVLYNVLHLVDSIFKQQPAEICIMPIKMNGIEVIKAPENPEIVYIRPSNNKEDSYYLKGIPKRDSIDCMQLVMSRRLWLSYGGWYDLDNAGDSAMYERFCKENDYVRTEAFLIGEHN